MKSAQAPRRPLRASPQLLRLAAMVVLLPAVASCTGAWVLRYGGKSCNIQEGMTIDQVRAACGGPTSSGTTPEVWQRSGCTVTACSAPGDIYETWLVRYDCTRRVMKVEGWPAGSFVEGL